MVNWLSRQEVQGTRSSTELRSRRATLVVPADQRRLIEKAIHTEADVLLLDLEDSVEQTDDAKAHARATLEVAIQTLDFGDKEVTIRLNAVESRWFAEDLLTCVACHPDAVIPAKIRSAADLATFELSLVAAGAAPDLRIAVGIETVGAVLRCHEIAAASDRVNLLRFGIGDYTLSMHGQFANTNDHLLVPLTNVLSVARDRGIMATAAVVAFTADRHLDVIRDQAILLRRLGYDGATVGRPSQVTIVNEVFATGGRELDWLSLQRGAKVADPGGGKS
ncbi:MAG: citrate lyase subunit beta / citryl-CoA lyase [Chloroflexota bacterium]|jgi:citrate lyase subunit beta/citryl-CoA lyase|nr:citrate lyase subunit beta / citryl-CoA lyase [Chloroflexota bacterium]